MRIRILNCDSKNVLMKENLVIHKTGLSPGFQLSFPPAVTDVHRSCYPAKQHGARRAPFSRQHEGQKDARRSCPQSASIKKRQRRK